jgi:transketolase
LKKSIDFFGFFSYTEKCLIMQDLKEKAKNIRRQVLEMIYKSSGAHIGSSLSCVDILTFLYFKLLNIYPENPAAENRDRFILSKGHAAAALYAVLSGRGFFEQKCLEDYCQDETKLAGHSIRQPALGIEASTGSLGHGLSMAVGMALAAKRDNKNHRVFVLLSDGECQEGPVWEAALFAGHNKLDNLIAIIDYNKIQAMGRVEEILSLEPLRKKWEDFNWSVKEADGHNFEELEQSFFQIPFEKGRPSLLIAHTIKGKGVSFLENKLISHYKKFSEEEYEKAKKELT